MSTEYGVSWGDRPEQTWLLGSLPNAELHQQRYSGSIRVRRNNGPWQPYEADDPAWPIGTMRPTVRHNGITNLGVTFFIVCALIALAIVFVVTGG